MPKFKDSEFQEKNTETGFTIEYLEYKKFLKETKDVITIHDHTSDCFSSSGRIFGAANVLASVVYGYATELEKEKVKDNESIYFFRMSEQFKCSILLTCNNPLSTYADFGNWLFPTADQ